MIVQTAFYNVSLLSACFCYIMPTLIKFLFHTRFHETVSDLPTLVAF